MIPAVVAGGLFDLLKMGIDKLVPNPEANAQAQLELMRLDQAGQLQEMATRMSAILAEAQSNDPWTSRARPSFLYVFYAIMLAMGLGGPFLGVFFPEHMGLFFENVNKGFAAIPEEVWWAFSACYMGYSGSKSFEAVKGVRRPGA